MSPVDNPLASSLTTSSGGQRATGDRSPVVLRNVASWHTDRAEAARAEGRTDAAERHDTIAYRLFKEARALRGLA